MRPQTPTLLKILNAIAIVVVVGVLGYTLSDNAVDFVRRIRSVSTPETQKKPDPEVYLTEKGRLRQDMLLHHLASGAIRPATRADLDRFEVSYDEQNPLRSVKLAWRDPDAMAQFFVDTDGLSQNALTSRNSAYVVLGKAGLISGSERPGEPRYLFIVENGASLSFDDRDGMPMDTADSLFFVESGAFRAYPDKQYFKGFSPFFNTPVDPPAIDPRPATVHGQPYPGKLRDDLPRTVARKCPKPFETPARAIWISAEGPEIEGASPIVVKLPESERPVLLVLTSQKATFWTIAPSLTKLAGVLVASNQGAVVETAAPVAALRACAGDAPLDAAEAGAAERMNAITTDLGAPLSEHRATETPSSVDLTAEPVDPATADPATAAESDIGEGEAQAPNATTGTVETDTPAAGLAPALDMGARIGNTVEN